MNNDEAMRELARKHLRQIFGENWEDEPAVQKAAAEEAAKEAKELAELNN